MNRRNFVKTTLASGAGLFAGIPAFPAEHQESDLSPESFIRFLEHYGDRYKASMRFQEDQDVHQWQQNLKQKITGLRGPVPERMPADVQILEEKELTGYKRQLIRFGVSELSHGIAYLLIPHKVSEGRGMVALHGHVEHGIQSICAVKPGYSEPYAHQAAESGYVVMAPAWWGWYGLDGHVERVGSRDKCNVIQMAASMYGINVLDLHIQIGQAAVDVLSQMSQVDPQRIACIGNSYGGRTAMWLTIFEDRIKACVPSGCMNTLRERSLKLSSCAIQYLPGVLRYGDVPELFGLIAPRPMQLQAGEGDGLITPEDRDQMRDFVARVYDLMGDRDKFDYVLHPHGHSLQWSFAHRFLEKYL